jgi:integrase
VLRSCLFHRGLAQFRDWYVDCYEELRDILGHANIATTDRYSHVNARRMQEMVEGP